VFIRKVEFPVNKDQKVFCDFMGYQFITQKGDHYVYSVPGNHICRFIINFDRWKKGQFDKEKFLLETELF